MLSQLAYYSKIYGPQVSSSSSSCAVGFCGVLNSNSSSCMQEHLQRMPLTSSSVHKHASKLNDLL